MSFDRERFARSWRKAFNEDLDVGLGRVKRLMRSFGVMSEFDQGLDGMTGGGFKFTMAGSFTRIDDRDFMRFAVLASVGMVNVDPSSIESVKLLTMFDAGPPRGEVVVDD